MGTVKMIPPDDVHGNARAVIVDRGSEGERYWRDRGYTTEEEVAGTGISAGISPDLVKKLQDEKQDAMAHGDGQEEAMAVHARQQEKDAKGHQETPVEKGEGAPGNVTGTTGSAPTKLSPDIDPDAPDDRPHVGRTALGVPTKPADVATGTGTATRTSLPDAGRQADNRTAEKQQPDKDRSKKG